MPIATQDTSVQPGQDHTTNSHYVKNVYVSSPVYDLSINREIKRGPGNIYKLFVTNSESTSVTINIYDNNVTTSGDLIPPLVVPPGSHVYDINLQFCIGLIFAAIATVGVNVKICVGFE